MLMCTAPVTGRHRTAEAEVNCPACSAATRKGGTQAGNLPLALTAPTSAEAESLSQERIDADMAAIEDPRTSTERLGEILRFYLNYGDRYFAAEVCDGVASHPNASPALLREMVLDASWKEVSTTVVEAVAGNYGAPQDVLHLVAQSDDPQVRTELVYNAGASEDILAALSEDPHKNVRAAVASGLRTPGRILHSLLDDPDPSVALNAREAIVSRMEHGLGVASDNIGARALLLEQQWWTFDADSAETKLALAVHPNTGDLATAKASK